MWLSYVAVRDATYARGCRVLPLGAPLHPKHESTSFGSLLGYGGHPVLFGISAGGVSIKIAPRSTKFHTPPGERFLLASNAHPGATKAP